MFLQSPPRLTAELSSPSTNGADTLVKKDNVQSRIQLLEEETRLLKGDVVKFLSIITTQTEQLSRQEKILAELRNKRLSKATKRVTMCWIVLLIATFIIICLLWIVPTLIPNDTVLYLNVKATPEKARFITAGVKVRFTMGDIITCAKGAFSGEPIGISLGKGKSRDHRFLLKVTK
jgi:hypothetical protein